MTSSNIAASPPMSVWQDAEQHLRAGRLDQAQDAYSNLLELPDWQLPAFLRLSTVANLQGRVRDAVALALSAHALGSHDAVMLEALARRLIDVGEMQAALDCALSPAVRDTDDPEILAGVGMLLSQQSFTEHAAEFLGLARQRGLDAPVLRHVLGLSALYAGDLEGARREIEASLQLAPDYAPAWRDLVRLQRATPEHNHVARLREAIARGGPANRGAPLLHYALFKEFDDLGEIEAAWQALDNGMRSRRAQVQHDPDGEQMLFEQLKKLTGGDAWSHAPNSELDPLSPQPIFIVGMPRSGTTLLERIIGAHSQVSDAGELRDFNTQLRWMCDCMGDSHLDLALARAAEDIDWAQLGERYLAHTQWRANGRPLFTDKLPANFVHVGHIARALPQARIVHMVRAPMEVCFSNLKELFAEAYPHSYDQLEMADHYLRYRDLMAHWHAQFPGRILDVDYHALVADPEKTARQVLDFCGLTWEPDVLAIESRNSAVATASATQVREPIHQRFVGQWRRYEPHLQPMRERLGTFAP